MRVNGDNEITGNERWLWLTEGREGIGSDKYNDGEEIDALCTVTGQWWERDSERW